MAQNLPSTRRDMREMSPFSMLQERIDRMFDDFTSGFGGLPSLSTSADYALMPSLEMHEQDGKLMINAELPGVDEKDIDLSVEDDVLTISGEKKSEFKDKQNGGYRTERMYGRFSRAVRLPFSVDASKVEARYDRGVLKLTIPRPAEAQQKTKKIEIKH